MVDPNQRWIQHAQRHRKAQSLASSQKSGRTRSRWRRGRRGPMSCRRSTGEIRGKGKKARLTGPCRENTVHIVLHLPATATATTAATAAAAASSLQTRAERIANESGEAEEHASVPPCPEQGCLRRDRVERGVMKVYESGAAILRRSSWSVCPWTTRRSRWSVLRYRHVWIATATIEPYNTTLRAHFLA